MAAAIDNKLGKLQTEVGQLRARIAPPARVSASGEQSKIFDHFLNRALQLSEASDLVCRARLGTPLFALMRILCEDLFLCFWVSMSEKDAAEYSSAMQSAAVRFVRIMLENGRGKIRHTSTHEDKTSEVLGKLKGTTTDSIKIEQLAIRVGLKKVYDLVYRYPSMEVHGKAYGLPSSSSEEGLFAAASAIVSLVESIGLIVDNRVLRNRATTADEILRLLKIEKIAGK